MPDMYKKDDIDLAGFVVGVVDKKNIIKPDLVNQGDVVLGLESSGIHSNGFSLVRKILKDKKLRLNKDYGFKSPKYSCKLLGEILMEPTVLYYAAVNDILQNKIPVNGISHITGGGFYENIVRIIPDFLDIEIIEGSWPVPEIFNFLSEKADIEKTEMYKVFNMGIGMVLLVNKKYEQQVIKSAKKTGYLAHRIGRVVKGTQNILIS